MNDGSLKVIPTNPQEVAEAEANMTQPRKDYNEGIDFLKNKEQSMAANAFHNALMGWEEEGDLHGVANASDQLGDICSERGDFDKALVHYDRAYKICTDDFDRYSLFGLEKKKAAIFVKMKRYEEALDMYWDIFDEYTGNRDPKGVVETLDIMADIFILNEDKERAADCYNMIAKAHRNFKHPEEAEGYETKAKEIMK
ncbi:MAG: tetratricopeptide repeat protein [Thermodesulfobacteriota bacterium]